MRDGDTIGALRWAAEAFNSETRGRRLTAWQIASSGPAAIDGATNIKEAAARRGVPERTIRFLLVELKRQFGMTPPDAANDYLGVTDGQRQNGKKLHPHPVTMEAREEDSAWNLPDDS